MAFLKKTEVMDFDEVGVDFIFGGSNPGNPSRASEAGFKVPLPW